MQHSSHASLPNTLLDKVINPSAVCRAAHPSVAGPRLEIAKVIGMDGEARAALEQLSHLAESGKVGVAGRFMPDGGVSARLARLGVAEHVDPADFFRFSKVVIPYSGVSPRKRRAWEEAGHDLVDLSSSQVHRAQVALGLLRVEGAQALVVGRHDDAESLAIAGGVPGCRILEDTTDTARLEFSPAFGVVCQTTLSPRRVSWLVQQLRLRWRDARITFLNTGSAAMVAREEALERLLTHCDRVVIVGDAGESSCEALAETALRRGRPAVVVAGAEDLDPADFSGNAQVAVTAGAFATDQAIRAVIAALAAG